MDWVEDLLDVNSIYSCIEKDQRIKLSKEVGTKDLVLSILLDILGYPEMADKRLLSKSNPPKVENQTFKR